MSSEALERAQRIREALGGEHAWRGGVEDARRVVADAFEALDALLAEVARLEQERDEALSVREGLISPVQKVLQLRDALAVAREREQRAVDALREYVEQDEGRLIYPGIYTPPEMARLQRARAALVDEPAADDEAWQFTTERIDFAPIWNRADFEQRAEAEGWAAPAAATLAEPE